MKLTLTTQNGRIISAAPDMLDPETRNLFFDPITKRYGPTVHVCPKCGRAYPGDYHRC